MDLLSVLQSLQAAAGPRGATYLGKHVRPEDTTETVLARPPAGIPEEGYTKVPTKLYANQRIEMPIPLSDQELTKWALLSGVETANTGKKEAEKLPDIQTLRQMILQFLQGLLQ